MTKQGKKRNLSFSPGGFAGMTTATIFWDSLYVLSFGKKDSLLYEGEHPFLREHYNYEVGMLLLADSKIDRLIRKRDSFKREGDEFKEKEYNGEINMALETFLVHWRGLIEFFYSDLKRKKKGKKESDDARVWDFFEESFKKSLLQKIREPKPSWLKCLKERANKEIAHLTYSRYYGISPEKDWPRKKMKTHLEKVMKRFLEELKLHILKEIRVNGLSIKIRR